MRWVVVAILLAALLPVPVASAATPWSVDATVAVQDATTADYTWRISGLSNTRLRLPLPDGATFVDARDSDGRVLDADVEGGDIAVSIGSKPANVKFRLTGESDGPFIIFPAQVASAEDSPVTIGITLPAGWSLAGYRDNDNDAPDASGVFRKTGPAYVQFLALPSNFPDLAPDTRVSGNTVRREGFANVTLSGIGWSLVTTYDTDVFSRDWDVHVPEGATILRAYTPYGDLTPTTSATGVKVRTPYPVGYGLGGRSFTVEMMLPAPEAYGGAFRQANVSVRAAEGDDVTLVASAPASLRYAGARVAGGNETAPMRFTADGPLSVGMAFLPSAAPGHVQFDEGAFVVDALVPLESAARATARNATALLPRVASFAYDAADTKPFYVAYTDADVFTWEEGFYSNGLNTISIRASTLANATDGAPHLVPVGVLLHEATHGLIDRRLPDAPHNLSFLHEGLARLAETQAEAYFASEVVACRQEFLTQRCDRHSARPGAEEVQARYTSGATFDIAWRASDVPDAARGPLYDYSGLVLHAFTQRAPVGALDNVIRHLERTRFAGEDGIDAGALTDILLANAPGTTAQALLYPSAEAASRPQGQFHFCMGTLVAPAYPWEEDEIRSPPGGCPPTGYGPRDSALPAPPPETVTPPTATTSAPPPTPPRISPPITVTPDAADPGGSGIDAGAGEAPGAVVEDPTEPPAPGSTEIVVPGPGIALLVGVIAIALVARRLRAH